MKFEKKEKLVKNVIQLKINNWKPFSKFPTYITNA